MQVCVLHGAKDLRIEERPLALLGPTDVRVQFGAGGVCGSDLHYYFHGRVGDFAVREPLILGHEMAGEVVETGAEVVAVRVGDRVAVNPSRPCWRCPSCQSGCTNLCLAMNFLGSAAVMPHVQGAFQEQLTVAESQCFVVPADLPFGIAAFAEPLAVCLHAVSRAGALMGKTVLVTGAGPIGALTCLAARAAGAFSVTATDVVAATLAKVKELGVDETIDVKTEPQRLEPLMAGKGRIDVAFEASGNPAALATCLDCVRPGGRIVQIGSFPPGGITIPGHKLMAKEIDLKGAFRFHDEFALAVRLLVEERLDVAPLLTRQFPMSARDDAFAVAADRTQAMKIQLLF